MTAEQHKTVRCLGTWLMDGVCQHVCPSHQTVLFPVRRLWRNKEPQVKCGSVLAAELWVNRAGKGTFGNTAVSWIPLTLSHISSLALSFFSRSCMETCAHWHIATKKEALHVQCNKQVCASRVAWGITDHETGGQRTLTQCVCLYRMKGGDVCREYFYTSGIGNALCLHVNQEQVRCLEIDIFQIRLNVNVKIPLKAHNLFKKINPPSTPCSPKHNLSNTETSRISMICSTRIQQA